MPKFFLLALLWFCVIDLFAQNTGPRLSGYVYDANSGEALVGATIYLPQLQKGVVSDNFGRFNLLLPGTETVQVQVSYVGFLPIDTTLKIEQNLSLDFRLQTQNLDEVVVLSKTGDLRANELNVPVERLKAIPMIFGQADLMKALTFLPGVTTGLEGTSGFFVRGGTPDQNLILLDGAPVYNASHLFGFQSVFDPNAIKDVKLIKGGFPARYGGRLSSIVDITMKDGNNQKHHGEFTLGLLNAGLMLEGPIKQGTSSFMVSARSVYLGLAMAPFNSGWRERQDSPANNITIFDVNAKFNHQFKNKDKLFVSFYAGQDQFLTRYRYDSAYYTTDLAWGNQTASVRYIHGLGGKVFTQSLLTYTHFFSRELNEQDFFAQKVKGTFLRESKVRDLTFKQFFSAPIGQKLDLQSGLELTQQFFVPTSVSLSSTDLSVDLDNSKSQSYDALSYALFGELDWNPKHWLNVNTGLRLANYGLKPVQRYLEPRLNVTARQGVFSYTLSYARSTQFVHLLANNSLGLFSDLWVPSTELVRPQVADQWSTGVVYRRPDGKWQASLEGFYKILNHQIDYRQGIDFFNLSNRDWQSLIETNGLGRARGLEAMLKRDTEKFNAWISYTLLYNERKFDNINDGNWYPFRYERRHNLNLNLLKPLGNNWSMGMNWVYQTGAWVTIQEAYILRQNTTPLSAIDLYDSFYRGFYLGTFVERRNNQRLPDYHRMDLSFSRQYFSKKHNGSSQLNLGFYNFYARHNPFTFEFRNIVNQEDRDRGLFSYKAFGRALFSVLPFISYTKKW
jgi:hypothetical protein